MLQKGELHNVKIHHSPWWCEIWILRKYVTFFCVDERYVQLHFFMHVWLKFSNWSYLGVNESHHTYGIRLSSYFYLFQWLLLQLRYHKDAWDMKINLKWVLKPFFCVPTFFQENLVLLHCHTLLFCVIEIMVFHTSLNVFQFHFMFFELFSTSSFLFWQEW